MLLAVCYFILRLVLQIVPEDDAKKREAEILVLRHQLAVLKRANPRPRLRRRDRMLIAAFSRLISRERWSGFVVTPATILRWHRELVARKWTFKHRKTGRQPLDPDVVSLIVEMAVDNPRLGRDQDQRRAPKPRLPGWSDHDPHDPPAGRGRSGSTTRRPDLVGVRPVPGSGHPRLPPTDRIAGSLSTRRTGSGLRSRRSRSVRSSGRG